MTGPYIVSALHWLVLVLQNNWLTVVWSLGMVVWYFGTGRREFLQKLAQDPYGQYSEPSLASALGVLGTFVGIAYGLLFFQSDNLLASVPSLLAGMRTAFFTSILGMVGSLRLNYLQKKARENRAQEPERSVNDLIYYLERRDKAAQEKQDALVEAMQHNNELLANAITDSMQKIYSAVHDVQRTIGGNATTPLLAAVTKTQLQLETEHIGLLSYLRLHTKKTNDALQSGASGIQKALEKHAADQKTDFQKFHQAIQREYQKTTDAVQRGNESMQGQLKTFAQTVNNRVSEAVVHAINASVRDFNDKIKEQFGGNFTQFGETVERLIAWQAEHDKSVSEVVEEQKNIASSLRTTRTAISKLESAVTALQDRTENATLLLTEIEKANGQLAETAGAMRQGGAQAAMAVAQIAETAEKAQRDMAAVAKDALKSVDQAAAASLKLAQQQQAVYRKADKRIRDYLRHLDQKQAASDKARQLPLWEQDADRYANEALDTERNDEEIPF